MALSAVLTSERPGSHVVATRGRACLNLEMLRRDVAAAIGQIRRRRITRGALMCRDAYWFAVGLFGLFAADAEAVVLPNSKPGTRTTLADSFDAIVTDDPALSDVVLRPGDDGDTFEDALVADACRLSIFTSGSTSAPKRVAKTLAQFEQEAFILEHSWGAIAADAVVAATVSHQHVYGLTFRLLWPLAAGRPFSTTTIDLWEDVFTGMAPGAVLISSPTHLLRLAGLPALTGDRRPRLVFTAGAPLPRAAARDAHRILGVLPTEIYGSTETGALATRQQTTDDVAWRPLPGIEIEPADGRLRVRSPSVAPGCWVETEDAIEMTSGGFMLRGRVDRVVKIEGKRVSLSEIERLLLESRFVADAVAIDLGEAPTVLAVAVVPTADGRAELAARGGFRFSRLLRHEIANKLDAAALPRRWRFVDAIPSAALGKRPRDLMLPLFQDVRDER